MNCQEWFFNFVQHYLFYLTTVQYGSLIWHFFILDFRFHEYFLRKRRPGLWWLIDCHHVLCPQCSQETCCCSIPAALYIQSVGANKLMIFFSGSPQSILLLSLEGSFRQCCQSRGRSSLVNNIFPTLPRVFFLPLSVKKVYILRYSVHCTVVW